MTCGTGPRPRLLLVDDEPANLQVLRQVRQTDHHFSHGCRRWPLATGCGAFRSGELPNAAPMHHAGEGHTMRKHPRTDAETLGENPSRRLRMARAIALAHPEKREGSGHSHGLAGKAVSLSAHTVAIAYMFDALTARRPCTEAWPAPQAMDPSEARSGWHFDLRPTALFALFPALLQQLLDIRAQWAD